MNESGASRFFDRFAITFDSFYDGKRNIMMQIIDKKFRKDMFERFKLTFDNMSDLPDRTVVDIGCGSGIYMYEALKRGAKYVTGVDPAPGMIELAQNRLSLLDDFAEHYKLVFGTFPDVEMMPHDYAIVMGVMDYVESPLEFLKKLKEKFRVAAFISFSSKHWLRTPIRKIRYHIRSCPVYFYDEKDIQELVALAGFNKFKIHKIDGAGLDYHVRLYNE